MLSEELVIEQDKKTNRLPFQHTNMAPSAITTTVTEEAKPRPTYKLNLGQYKEIDPYNVDRDVETGKKGGNGAKV
jgi:hypothetical protein